MKKSISILLCLTIFFGIFTVSGISVCADDDTEDPVTQVDEINVESQTIEDEEELSIFEKLLIYYKSRDFIPFDKEVEFFRTFFTEDTNVVDLFANSFEENPLETIGGLLLTPITTKLAFMTALIEVFFTDILNWLKDIDLSEPFSALNN
ncbi:MAG: hypothetical protein IKH13_01245 [Clostridia bacterium]|nr:hypothetical protein [Clostridia bacterium]